MVTKDCVHCRKESNAGYLCKACALMLSGAKNTEDLNGQTHNYRCLWCDSDDIHPAFYSVCHKHFNEYFKGLR